jgi:gas vesicle protein
MSDTTHSESQKGSTSFFGGLIVGALFGAVAALLYAPQSGQQMRDQLTKAGEDALVQGQKIMEEARERAEAIIADAQRRAERIAEAARNNVSDLNDAVQTELTH